MKIKTRTQLRKEMRQIISVVRRTPDSLPLGIMEAGRTNSSRPWNERRDAKNCDSSAPEMAKRFGQATRLLAKRK